MKLVFRYLLFSGYAILYFTILELIRFHTDFWWIGFSMMIVATIALTWYLGKRKINIRWVQFLIAPLFFFISSFWFFLFISSAMAYHLFAILVAMFFWIYFEQVLNYFYYPFRYHPYTLENFSYYLGLLSFFFFFSAFYSSIILLQLPLWLLGLVAATVALILTHEIFWFHKIDLKKSWLFNLIISLVVLECFVALSFLPTTFYVSALFLTIIYYLISGLSKNTLLGNLTKKMIVTHITVSSVCFLLVLLTAHWI